MESNRRVIDGGVRDVVALFNRLPGVVTRASCEGVGRGPSRHRHADLAYVLLRYPMPLDLQEFLVAHLGDAARIESTAVYSRWPESNPSVLARLAELLRQYEDAPRTQRRRWVRRPLPRLRARLARHLDRSEAAQLAWCSTCGDTVAEPHSDTHAVVPLLRLASDQQVLWFAEFASQVGNTLDAALVAADGWSALLRRTQRGDFGLAFRRRWQRDRARRTAELVTSQLRAGVDAARRSGLGLDFYHDATHAVFGVD